MTLTFAEFVEQRFGGRLYKGAHSPDGKACLHEALAVYQGKPWSDDTTGTIDLRVLNDAPWSSDEARTAAMLPLGAIVLGWPSWSPKKRQAWAKAVAEGVIRRILPPTLRTLAERVPSCAPDLVAAALRCETEGSESAAESAWSAAESASESAWSAAESASESARSAWSAAESARSAWSAAESAESAARWAAESAWSAAESASESAWSAAESASESAWSAAESAAESARSAWSAATDRPLQELAAIMVEAAGE